MRRTASLGKIARTPKDGLVLISLAGFGWGKMGYGGVHSRDCPAMQFAESDRKTAQARAFALVLAVYSASSIDL